MSIAEQVADGTGIVNISGKVLTSAQVAGILGTPAPVPAPQLREDVKTPAPEKTGTEKQIDIAQQQLDTQKELVTEIRKVLQQNRVEMKNEIELIINKGDDEGSQLESAILRSLDNVADRIESKL